MKQVFIYSCASTAEKAYKEVQNSKENISFLSRECKL